MSHVTPTSTGSPGNTRRRSVLAIPTSASASEEAILKKAGVGLKPWPAHLINFGTIGSPVEPGPDPLASKTLGTKGPEITHSTHSQTPSGPARSDGTASAVAPSPNKFKGLSVHSLFQTPAATTPGHPNAKDSEPQTVTFVSTPNEQKVDAHAVSQEGVMSTKVAAWGSITPPSRDSTQVLWATTEQSPSPPLLDGTASEFDPALGDWSTCRSVQIGNPAGGAFTSVGQIPPSSRVTHSKRSSVVVPIETQAQRDERLAKEKGRKEDVQGVHESEAGGEATAKIGTKSIDSSLSSAIPDRLLPKSTSATAPGPASYVSFSATNLEHPKRPIPGPLDLSSKLGNRSAAPTPTSTLGRAGFIEDLSVVPYPEAIKIPNPDSNIGGISGKFRYDRDFLLQFRNFCKERPQSLPPLDSIGLQPREQGTSTRTRDRRTTVSSVTSPQRQSYIGLGASPVHSGEFTMGNFQFSPRRVSEPQLRFDPFVSARGGIPFLGPMGSQLMPLNLSKRPKRAKDGSTYEAQHLNPVSPLQVSENRWVGVTMKHASQKLQGLLNKLTVDNFDAISDLIVLYADRSEQAKDGSMLMEVAKLVFNTARDDRTYSDLYAQLCHKMMEHISPSVQDETIRSWDEQSMTGGILFRKYLVRLCQEEFERGWGAGETELAVASRVKRRGLGLFGLMGELFKRQVLTERIMHDCIKKFLSNAADPEKEDIEGLYVLLHGVGKVMDNSKARGYVDNYFEQINDMANQSKLGWRLRFMLLDLIELRARQWQVRSVGLKFLEHEDQGAYVWGAHHYTTGHDECDITRETAIQPSAHPRSLSELSKVSKSTRTQFSHSSIFSKKDSNGVTMSHITGTSVTAKGSGADERDMSTKDKSPIAASKAHEVKKLDIPPWTDQAKDKEAGEEDKEGGSAPVALPKVDSQKKINEDIKE